MSEARAAVTDPGSMRPSPGQPRVAMALYGDLTFDSRVRKEARSLAEAGYDVTIVCLASGATASDLPANVTVLVRLPTGAKVIPGSSNPFFTGKQSRIGALRRRAEWLASYVRGLRQWGRLAVKAAGPVDAWHAHDLTGLAAIVPSLRDGVPLVYDSHELFLESGTATALPGLARRPFGLRAAARPRAAAVITVNDEIAAVFAAATGRAPPRSSTTARCSPRRRRASLIRDATA